MRNESVLSSDDDYDTPKISVWDNPPKKEKGKFEPIYKLISGCNIPTRYFDKNTKSYKTTFVDHKETETIFSIQFSSCGQYLLTSSTDNTIKLWDMTSFKGVYTYTGCQMSRRCIPKFVLEEEFIFSGGDDGSIHIWETFKGLEPCQSGNQSFKLQSHKFPIRTISFDPEEFTMVSGDESGQLQIKYLY